jgi:hypothetical protein
LRATDGGRNLVLVSLGAWLWERAKVEKGSKS